MRKFRHVDNRHPADHAFITVRVSIAEKSKIPEGEAHSVTVEWRNKAIDHYEILFCPYQFEKRDAREPAEIDETGNRKGRPSN